MFCVLLASQLVLHDGSATAAVRFVAPNVVRVHYEPDGKTTPQTLVLRPQARFVDAGTPFVFDGKQYAARTDDMHVTVRVHPLRIDIADGSGRMLVRDASFGPGALRFTHGDNENFYGIDGFSLPGQNVDVHQDVRNGVLRFGGRVAANGQGDGGAPLAYTTAYGVLVDSDGGNFSIGSTELSFTGGSRPDTEAFIIAGAPEDVMAAVGAISGTPPMSPKWTLGFINSQWGTTEDLIRGYVRTYRAKGIPLDGFIMDFDWKAWGEDDYGEWRWNEKKFPSGRSGKFAQDMLAAGVHLAGIFKPRILLTNANGTPTKAAAYATAHGFWYPEKPYTDYFSGRPARDIDFSKAPAREWFWQHTIPAYRSGISAFWNDEADIGFGNFQFANMQRSFYDGVRSIGDARVWSLNRNFYLGAQRYGYAEWSGDISFGFDSMLDQATRMLSTIDLGEEKWSMDTGGFFGTPSPENYARWVEFAAFVPIMRVHCTLGQYRQPWVFGPIAEAAAKRAILLRHAFFPYIYSYDREAYERNVGLVRPLFWEFPNDDTDTIPYVDDEWMFGKWLLVAPIFGEGQAHRSVFLPPGAWTDYFRGTRYTGGRWIEYDVDPHTWRDIPLFIREGAIIPTQGPPGAVYLDVYPAAKESSFEYYDDDGATYAYERGGYFKQRIRALNAGVRTHVWFDAPEGRMQPHARTYIVRMHLSTGTRVFDVRAGRQTAVSS